MENKNFFLIVFLIIIFLIAIKLMSLSIINNNYLKLIENGKYQEAYDEASKLLFLNFFESYIVYYNQGISKYELGMYTEAEELFYKSIEQNPSKNKICDVRINLALSIAAQGDELASSNATEALSLYKSAREILYEDGCANENDNNGSSQAAEEAEEYIRDKENAGEENEDSTSNKDENNDEEEEVEGSAEEELKKNLEDSQSERQSELQEKETRADYEYNYGYKNW